MTENRTDGEVIQEPQPSLSGLDEGVRLPNEKARGNRRKRMLLALLAFLLLAAITGAGVYRLLRAKTVDLKANKRLAERVSNGEDIKKAAFDSIRASLT